MAFNKNRYDLEEQRDILNTDSRYLEELDFILDESDWQAVRERVLTMEKSLGIDMDSFKYVNSKDKYQIKEEN